MKVFNEQENIGKAKYVVNFHDGVKQHKDGSPFFDIRIFTNKKKKAPFIKSLEEQGYTYGDYSTLTKNEQIKNEHEVKYPNQMDFLNACDDLSKKLYGKSSIFLVECEDIATGELTDAFANDLSPNDAIQALIQFDKKDQPKNGAELLNKYIRSLGKSQVHYALYEPEHNAIDIVCFLPLSMTSKTMEIDDLCAEYRLQYFDGILTCLAKYNNAGEDIDVCINDSDIQLIKEAYLDRIAEIELLASKYNVNLGEIDRESINT